MDSGRVGRAAAPCRGLNRAAGARGGANAPTPPDSEKSRRASRPASMAVGRVLRLLCRLEGMKKLRTAASSLSALTPRAVPS